jgi:hypothetical protein
MKAKFPFGVSIQFEKKVAPGIYSSRATDGLLDLHNRRIFLGYVTRWCRRGGSSCWRVHTWSEGPAHFTVTKNFDTQLQAEAALVRYGVQLQRVAHLNVRQDRDGWFRIVNISSNRPISVHDEWKGIYVTKEHALKAVRRLSRIQS